MSTSSNNPWSYCTKQRYEKYLSIDSKNVATKDKVIDCFLHMVIDCFLHMVLRKRYFADIKITFQFQKNQAFPMLQWKDHAIFDKALQVK